jgi:tol-pal system protein YbgF
VGAGLGYCAREIRMMIMLFRTPHIALAAALFTGLGSHASALPLTASSSGAQAASPVVLVQLFGQQRGGEDSEMVARMSRLENQIRQLTGMIEEMQHRTHQLEQQLQRAQQDIEFRFQEMNPSGRPPAARGQSGSVSPQASPPPGPPPLASRPASGPPPIAAMPDQAPPASGGRRGDVFDPTAAPDAPGAPRVLGSVPSGSEPAAPQRRDPGTPLDLGSLAGLGLPGNLPQQGTGGGSPPPGVGSPVGQQAVLAPSGSARDEYDLAYGAVQRRDYELAVEGFRIFLANHSGSREPEAQRIMPEAHYWLGESQFQLKQYSESAETFLKISTDFPNAVRAPDALLRLGQSLAALGERETACASLGHVLTKYPKASANVKRAVEQEQKRVRC